MTNKLIHFINYRFAVAMTILLLGSNALFSQNFSQGLIAHWKFDNNANDETTFGNNGTASNTATIAGVNNQGYQFNGSSRVTVPNSASLSSPTTAFSTAFWVKIDQFAPFPYAPIFCKSDVAADGFQYALWISANLVTFQVNNYTASNVTIPYNFTTNTWYHVGLTYQSGVTTLFVNGNAVRQRVLWQLLFCPITNLYLSVQILLGHLNILVALWTIYVCTTVRFHQQICQVCIKQKAL
jgi:Concanavalin A-like lectin/glucanases superfamily